MSDCQKPVSSLEDLERGTTLPALIARLIEAYEANPGRVVYLLRFRHLQSLRTNSTSEAPLEAQVSLATGAGRSKDQARRKIAHSPTRYLDTYQALLERWYKGNSSMLEEKLTKDEVTSWDSDFQLSNDELSERGSTIENLKATIEREAAEIDRNPELRIALAREWGLSEESDSIEILTRRYQNSEFEIRRRHFHNLREPNEAILWAKELVGRLIESVKFCRSA